MNIFLRIVIAVVCFVLLMALVPPVFALLSLSVDPNLIRVIQVCAAGAAIFYILRGPNPPL